jgi:signal peptidase I
MVQKQFKTTSKINMTSWLVFFVITLVIIAGSTLALNHVPYFKDRTNFAIVTDSMEPVLNVGDVVVVDTGYDIALLAVDDIIAFSVDVNDDEIEEVVLHYIASITEDSGEYTIRTNSEKDVNLDTWILSQEDVIGLFDFRIPFLGSLLLFLSSAFGKAVIIFDIILVFLLVNFFGNKKVVEETHFITKDEEK